MQSLIENTIWRLVKKPKGQTTVQYKWIYKLKEGNNPPDPLRYKVELVVKCFAQREGTNYNGIFSFVFKYKTLRLILALV